MREPASAIDGLRRQDRENVSEELGAHASPFVLREIVPVEHFNAGAGECGDKFALDERRVPFEQLLGTRLNRYRLLQRIAPVWSGVRSAGGDLPLHACDADHEKLIEIGREDRGKFCPFEQRQRSIFRLIEHARVEREPAQFPIDKEIGREWINLRSGLDRFKFE
ncbi:MAG: hypothetical protein R2845_12180 [Thermomicrobiales bacterium]